MSLLRRLFPLAALVALLACAAPALAHDTDDAVPLQDEHVGGVDVEVHGDRIPAGTDKLLLQSSRRRAIARVEASDLDAGTLADSWCGTERATDDTADDATSAGASIKLIYARPSDVASQFASRATLIQQDVRDISQSFALAAAGTKTVRFDVGTSCGPIYADILSVTLPRPQAQYTGVALQTRVDRLQSDLRPLVAGISGTHDYLVYAEGLYAGDGVSGVATLYNDDTTGAGNASNRGGQFAFVLGFGSGNRRTTAQHELGHNLGAVQNSAPHSTQAGHCFENFDVMCYADGGPRGQTANLTNPPACTNQSSPAWDCDADDYFNPLPAPGSYLATHWNLYNSTYLCVPGACFDGTRAVTPPSIAPAPAPAPAPGGGSGGGGSSGGGGTGGGSGPPSTPAPTAPAPTSPGPGSSPSPPQVIVPAPSSATSAAALSTRIRAALAAVEASFQRTLSGSGLRALRTGRTIRVRVTSPAAGYLTARIMLRGHRVLRGSATVRANRATTIVIPVSARAHRAFRTARPSAVRLELSLQRA